MNALIVQRPTVLGRVVGTPKRIPHVSRPNTVGIRAFKEGEENKPVKGLKEANPATPAFSRRREHFVGRAASFGFASGLIGELMTGLGPFSQLSHETGLPVKVLYGFTGLFVLYQLFGGVGPSSATFDRSNQADVRQRDSQSKSSNPLRALGLNEVIIGRVAMLGFAGASVLEFLWAGESPLAHVGLIRPGGSLLGAPWYFQALVVLFAVNALGLFSKGEETDRV